MCFSFSPSHLGVAREDLVLDLVDVAVDGGEQLLPADAQRLHRVLGVAVLEYHTLLYGLVDLLKLLEVGLVRVDRLLVLLQPVQLILQCTLFKNCTELMVENKLFKYPNEQIYLFHI